MASNRESSTGKNGDVAKSKVGGGESLQLLVPKPTDIPAETETLVFVPFKMKLSIVV